jgi:hypothetical protein
MSPIVLGLPGDGPRTAALAARLGARAGTLLAAGVRDVLAVP